MATSRVSGVGVGSNPSNVSNAVGLNDQDNKRVVLLKKFKKELKDANKIIDWKDKSLVMGLITHRMAEAGFFKEALEVARSIRYWENESASLWDIACTMVDARYLNGDIPVIFEEALNAKHLFAYLGASLPCDPNDGSNFTAYKEQSKFLRDIASKMPTEGFDKRKVLAVFNLAIRIAKITGNLRHATVFLEKAAELSEIALAMDKAGFDKDRVASIFIDSLNTLNGIQEEQYELDKFYARRDTAKAMAEVGLYDQALQVADIYKKPSDRIRLRCTLIPELVNATKFGLALELAAEEPNPLDRFTYLQNIYLGMLNSYYNINEVKPVLDRALVAARETSHPWPFLREISSDMAKMGLFKEALQTIATINDSDDRSRALADIALYMSKAGFDRSRIISIFSQAMMVARINNASWVIPKTLAYIIENMTKVNFNKEEIEQMLRETGN